jgi:DNA-binding response OmpR family regulator
MRVSARVHLLVVEDSELLRGALVRIFRRFHVVACATLAEAERVLATAVFDAVISDVQLPDGSGVDLFHRVHAVRPAQAERFVFASGAADDPTVSKALEATGRPFVRKPFEVRPFIELVTSVVERRRPCAISGSYRVGRAISRV